MRFHQPWLEPTAPHITLVETGGTLSNLGTETMHRVCYLYYCEDTPHVQLLVAGNMDLTELSSGISYRSKLKTTQV